MAPTNDYYKIHHYRLDYLLDQITKLNLKPNSTILDVGCYPPYLFNILKTKYQVFGISSPHEPVKTANVTTLDIETDAIKFSTKFDLIIFTEIIEHLTNPISVLQKLTPLLKDDGLIIITTPNFNRWQNLFLQIFGKNIYFYLFQLTQSINFRHQREYTLSELSIIAQDLHLHTLKLHPFIGYPPFRTKNKNDRLFLKFTKYTIYILAKVFPFRQDSLLGIFQK